MSDRPLFRPEAVEHHARGLVTNRRQLDLSSRTTTSAFRLLLLLIAVALVAAFTIRTDESARGGAVSTGRETTVLVPIGALPRLRPGQVVRVKVGDRTVEGRITSLGSPTAGPPPAVPARASFDTEIPAGSYPEAVVRLERHTIAEMLLPRLKSLFGRPNA